MILEMKKNIVLVSLLCLAANVLSAPLGTESNSVMFLDVNPSFHSENSTLTRDRISFISCYDSNLTNANYKFCVDLNGRVWTSRLIVYGGGGINMSNQSIFAVFKSDDVDLNNGFLLDSYGYGGAKPMGVSASKFFVYCPMVVNGTITCEEELKVVDLDAKNIKTQDITVKMNDVADYVFDEGYDLKPLSEVETYVKENKHLPGIPAASEMEQNGMSMSAMSNMLLKKVEELTLHMIRLEKENAELKAKVEELSK